MMVFKNYLKINKWYISIGIFVLFYFLACSYIHTFPLLSVILMAWAPGPMIISTNIKES